MTKDEESAFRRWWCNYEITRKEKSEIVAKDAFCAGVSALMLVKQTLENDNAILRKRNAELEKENAELTCQMKRNFYCYSCKNATEKCYKKEIGCPCGKYESYKDENAELKGNYEQFKAVAISEIEGLKKDNAYFKEYNERIKAIFDLSIKGKEELKERLDEAREENRKLAAEARKIINDLCEDIIHTFKHYPDLACHKKMLEDMHKASQF